MKNVIIIGGGASGLMAAYTALKNNANVVIVEKKERIGSKILATGNGHCNFTNEYLDTDCYYNDSKEFIKKAFELFDNKSIIEFFSAIGVPSKNKNSYYYPYSMEASSILNAFRTAISSDRLTIVTEANVLSLNKYKNSWTLLTDKGKFNGDSIIISCGSNASSKKDMNGSVIKQIISLGHKFINPKPALTYFKIKEEDLKLAAGVRFPVKIKLLSDNSTVTEENGELQITARGISGICVFQLSRFVSRNPDIKFRCEVDFMPEFSIEEISGIVYGKLRLKTDMNIEEMFNGILPKKLIIALAKMADLSIGKAVYVQENQLRKFIDYIKKCNLNIIDTGDISESQCLTGGVSTSEINPLTMESLLHDNLYFSGEIIDVDGKCGGYNLQWAWTSGYIAGLSASE